jgi:hypothetical protein
MSVGLILDEQRTANALRDAWLTRRQVRLTLTSNCMIRTVVGKVSSVAVTGAFATVDGWHVPTVNIEGLGKPTVGDVEAYARAMHDLREGADAVVRIGDGWRPPGGRP